MEKEDTKQKNPVIEYDYQMKQFKSNKKERQENSMRHDRKVDEKNFEQAYYNAQDTYEDENTWLRNKNFVQMYDGYNDKLLQLALKDGTALAVFLFLSRFAEQNNTIKVSNKDIQDILKKSASTVKRSLKTLKDMNMLTVIKSGRDNVYFINPSVMCCSNAYYKSKLMHQYKKLAGSMVPNDLEANIIDTKRHADFKGREKEIYRFAFKTGDKEPEIDEIMEKLELLEKANEIETEVKVVSLECDDSILEFPTIEETEKITF